MIRQNEVEEIISLINDGYDAELLSFELDLPFEQVLSYEKQLKLRKFASESIKSGNIQIAIQKLKEFIDSTDNNIVEKAILLKLNAYANRTNVNQDEIEKLEEEKKKLGFSRNIEEILAEFQIQIPKRKSSNMKKKKKQSIIEETNEINIEEDIRTDEENDEPNYEETINIYKNVIAKKTKNCTNERNLLAFAYFRAGRIDEARDELLSIIEQTGNYTAYRQLIHLEKTEGNFNDAKLWAYDVLEKFPDSIDIREQLISIARKEKNSQEIIKLLREIIEIYPKNEKYKKRLEIIKNVKER